MNLNILIGLAWGFSVAIAYWFGSLHEGPRLKDDSLSSVGSTFENLAPVDAEESSGRLDSIDSVKGIGQPEETGKGSPPVPAEDFENAYHSRPTEERLRNASGPVEKMTVLMEALQRMDASNVEEVVAAFEAHTEPNRRYSELRLLLFAWAEFDPQSAVEWADKLNGWEERTAVGAVLERWATNDLDASLTWAREKFKGDDNPYLVGIIGGLSRSDPDRASELMLEMPYGRNRGRAASTLLDVYWKRGERDAMDWAEQMKEGSIKDFVSSQLAERIAREDVGRSARWVESLEDGRAKSRAVGTVAYHWGRADPALASQRIDGMSEDGARFAGMEGLVKVWVGRDAAATAEWLNGYESSEGKDGAVEIFVNAIKRKDPASAMQWAESMTDQKERGEAIEEVERIWRRGDPETYQNWKQARSSSPE